MTYQPRFDLSDTTQFEDRSTLRVLVGCEYSGRIRDALIRRGYSAVSCDLLPTERPGPHLQCDIREVLNDGWHLGIFHPECTYLTVSGLHWNKRDPARAAKTEEALEFVQLLLNAPILLKALENPVGCISTRIRRPDQIIQPYEFGDDASKKTCWWLEGGLTPLPVHPARRCSGREVEYPPGSGRLVERWSNQIDSGQNALPPSEDRWKLRSETYPGIAEAVAEHWGAEAFSIINKLHTSGRS